jgi:spore coat polysaccharide biosynthesis protein SpsF (cytidylyltransferase family)
MSRAIAIIQARLGSRRLPRKVLEPIGDQSLLAHVVQRVRAMRGLDGVLLALPELEIDAWLETGVLRGLVDAVYIGPTEDVLGRFRGVAALARADVIVRVTGDCPLWAPDVASDMLQHFLADGCDYMTNDVTRSGFPDGTDVQIFTRELLEAAACAAQKPYDREHVCPWMGRHARRFGYEYCVRDARDLKMSVDTAEDLARVRRISAELRASDVSLASTFEAAERAGVWSRPWRRSAAS